MKSRVKSVEDPGRDSMFALIYNIHTKDGYRLRTYMSEFWIVRT